MRKNLDKLVNELIGLLRQREPNNKAYNEAKFAREVRRFLRSVQEQFGENVPYNGPATRSRKGSPRIKRRKQVARTKNKALEVLHRQIRPLADEVIRPSAPLSAEELKNRAVRAYCLWLQYLITDEVSVGPWIIREWDSYGCSERTGQSL